MTSTETNFNTLWHDAIKWHCVLTKHANSIRTAVRLFRRAAYRFAKAYVEMEGQHHNEFLQMVESGGTSMCEWMDQHFDVIEQMGDDRTRLFASIREGMTEKEYVEAGRLWIIRRHLKAPSKAARTDTESNLNVPLTIEEKLDHLQTENGALRSEVHQLRHELHIALKENNKLVKALEKADKILKAVNRKAG